MEPFYLLSLIIEKIYLSSLIVENVSFGFSQKNLFMRLLPNQPYNTNTNTNAAIARVSCDFQHTIGFGIWLVTACPFTVLSWKNRSSIINKFSEKTSKKDCGRYYIRTL